MYYLSFYLLYLGIDTTHRMGGWGEGRRRNEWGSRRKTIMIPRS